MTNEENPYCVRCGFRTYPQWGDHDCVSPPDVARLRHVAGDILSNLHFYRVPVELQIAALAEAWAWTFASNCDPSRIEVKMRKLFPDMLALAKRQAGRDPRTDVQDMTKKVRLKAKVRRVKVVASARHKRPAPVKAAKRAAKKRVGVAARAANPKRHR